MKSNKIIETLESRIAPATLINATTVVYSDADGDSVTVTTSAGTFDLDQFTFAPSGMGEVLARLDISGDQSFQGAKIKITAEDSGGDGLVSAAKRISAIGVDLRSVSVDGDLLRIDVGDANETTNGLGALKSRTLGQSNSSIPFDKESPTESHIAGGLGSLTVIDDVEGASVEVTGSIGRVTIGGSLIGKATGGEIVAGGSIGPVTIGGDIVGGGSSFFDPGSIETITFLGGRVVANGGGIESVKVGGSVLGSGFAGTGFIFASGAVNSIRIGGDLKGGSFATETGSIQVDGNLAKLSIGGSIVGGGVGSANGGVQVTGKLGQARIFGDVRSGDADANQTLERSGFIAAERLGSLHIGGSLIGGTRAGTGTITESASILVSKTIGSVTIAGSVDGNGAKAGIYAGVFENAGSRTSNVVIKRISVGGDVEQAIIAAGFLPGQDFLANSEVQIGKVTVKGNWNASDLAAGATRGPDGVYGTADDVLVAGAPLKTGVISSIAKITIRGQVLGTILDLDDGFGFVAERIGSFTVGGTKLALRPGPNSPADSSVVAGTSDVRIAELT